MAEAFPPNFPNPNQEGGSPMAGVQITGNVPPELLAKLKQGADSPPVAPMPAPSAPTQPVMPPQAFSNSSAGQYTQSNANLDAILSKLRQQSNVYEEVVLPSLGRFYNGSDGPVDGKLHIRPMCGEEEQILATPRFVRKGQAIDMIFSRCIQEQFKPADLLSADRTFLLIYLRGISYGSEYEVEVKDPESDRKFSTVIDLDSLVKNVCPREYGPTLTDTLPKSGLSFTYRLSRGKDETELQEYRERRLKQYGDNAADDTLLFRSTQLVESIADIMDKTEIQIILRNLPIQDLSYLRQVVNEPPFGVDTKVPIVSPLTSEEFEVDLPLESAFFFPRRKKKAPTLA